MDEQTPPDVADAYSLSKQVDERTAAAFARSHDLTVVAFRFPYTATAARFADVRGRAPPSTPSAGCARAGPTSTSATPPRPYGSRWSLALPAAAYVVGLAAPDNLPGHRRRRAVASPRIPTREVRGDVRGSTSLYSSARAAELLGWRARHVRAWEKEIQP